MRILPVVALCALAASALADNKSEALIQTLDVTFGDRPTEGSKYARVVLLESDTKLAPNKGVFGYPGPVWNPYDPVIAFAADGSAGWLAAGLGDVVVCGMGDCEKVRRDAVREMMRKPPYHVTALVDGDQPVFVHFGSTGKGVGNGELGEDIEYGAKDVANLFDATIGDPKAFAATVSSRKDAMMFGTEANERYVGGETVRATLVKWNLSLKRNGGIRAGTTKSKTVAWVLADVGVEKKERVPYRVSAVYEKTGGKWKIVQLHFS
jgi:hypothetical protein